MAKNGAPPGFGPVRLWRTTLALAWDRPGFGTKKSLVPRWP
jgi:hypothetical protein